MGRDVKQFVWFVLIAVPLLTCAGCWLILEAVTR